MANPGFPPKVGGSPVASALEAPWVKFKVDSPTPPPHKGQRETEERGRPLQTGRNLHLRFVLGSHKTSKSSHSATRILKVLTELSHIYHPNSLKTHNSQVVALQIALAMGMVGREYIAKAREWVRRLSRFSFQVNLWSCPLDDLLQH